jgi:hypothetical protein
LTIIRCDCRRTEINYSFISNFNFHYIIYKNFSAEFIHNVEKNGINLKYIKENNYHYCGGISNKYNDLNFNKYFENKQIPHILQTNKCICGKEIEDKYYIIGNDNIIKILGGCCIDHFKWKYCKYCKYCEDLMPV